MSARILVAAVLVVAGACAAPDEKGVVDGAAGAGTYVVLADSTRVHFVAQVDGRSVGGSFTRVVGSLDLRETAGGFLEGTGSLSVDLASAQLADPERADALRRVFFRADASRELRTAELVVRRLYGSFFTPRIPSGGVTPVSANARLRVHGMVLTRQLQGEISRTPSGYRITTAAPVLLSISELGMGPQLAAWREAVGAASVGEGVALTADLRLGKRAGPAPAGP